MGLLSKATKTEEKLSRDSLPAYTQTPDQQPGVASYSLNLAQNAGPAAYTTVTHSECIAHLKFLAALSDLRDTVTSIPNTFDIPDPDPRECESHINEAWALVKEKRWAVYTAKAVARYTSWWNACVPASRPRPTVQQLSSSEFNDIILCNSPLTWARNKLPPLDVLMVWHAHMLNPRAFLEDCIRHGKISFWSAGFPWEAINASIDDQALVYDTGSEAATAFNGETNLEWDILQDMPSKMLDCPSCSHINFAPWARGRLSLPLESTFDSWTGYTDKNFRIYCSHCKLRITHDTLRVQKFRNDISDLLDGNLPMPGTILNSWGIPEPQSATRRRLQQANFPNRLLQTAKRDIREYMRSTLWVSPSVTMLRDYLGALVQDKEVMRRANPTSVGTSLYKDEKIAFRRMMSRYWDNSSQFALELVGAVVRQGTFINKMDNIDWLHSPTLTETMLRLIRKYAVFFQIMASNPGRMAVPTLDVDLAWHTHQLTPGRYFEFSIHHTKQDGRCPIFIDHDDKVSETKLSDGFEWTAKMYRKLTDGGIYSECTCWYCEATRGADIYSRMHFPASSGAKARSAAVNLHDNPEISSDPEKNPHISAHSAVKTKNIMAAVDPNLMKFLKLRSDYERSCRRADKRNGKSLPDKDTKAKRSSKYDTDAYAAYPLMWGYPVYVPYYAPYAGDPGVHCDAYAADPSCMSLQPGHPGNCATGTCGGAVAAGACGGKGGGCSGGCAGGGCGGGGGGCGGGGCGGGGGGGGCGGGGGGGC
ncbi:uncharacterized protein DSM5745_11293 [Aspergillus mulundensis]|uniref:Alpha-ketoglutarate-dependent sulfonate dioxygenase n=1 Tax=Aspergillus mulundensis TaxID=1810919 RepID=A0A3D8Q7V8_9EURO|nr:Uncharacterized protein DSM5745_11293 [Aspergillus mulundensis]RDW57913.1 Uncharacterized protein DSM5745_11293 [Aspergillus mulundensis]